MLVRATNTFIAHGTSGAARIRHSLRPLITGGREKYPQTSGATCREIAKVRVTSSIVIVRQRVGRMAAR